MASILLKIGRICHSQLKCNYLKNEKLFLNFLFYFWNLHKFLNIWKQRWSSELMYFRSYRLWTSWLDHFVKSVVSKNTLNVNMWNRPWVRFYHVFSSFWWKLIWEKSPLVLREILGVFVNTLTAEGKYPVQDWENLVLPVQNQLCGKRTTLSEFFVPFVKYT